MLFVMLLLLLEREYGRLLLVELTLLLAFWARVCTSLAGILGSVVAIVVSVVVSVVENVVKIVAVSDIMCCLMMSVVCI